MSIVPDLRGEIIPPRKKINITIDPHEPPPEFPDVICSVCEESCSFWSGYHMKRFFICSGCCARTTWNQERPGYPDNTVFAAAQGAINAIKKEVKRG